MAEPGTLINLMLMEFIRAIFGEPYLFWVVMALVALQYRKIAKNRERLFGIRGDTVVKDTLVATGFGLAGGLVASLLLVITGVNLTSLGISWLWGLALLLMLINPRFLCFSYSGGIIALTNLIFGVPDIDVPQLMGLIAILHLIESLLIYFSGHVGATPMYTKTADGRLVGGFTLQKFWPLPVVAIAILELPEALGYSMLPPMPEWWPAIRFGQYLSINSVGVLIPLIVGLGYGDIALAHTPAEKSRMSARHLSIYSMVLLGLAILASRYTIFNIIAALFAPLGHEAVIFIGQRTEKLGRPLYVPPNQGVKVLEAVTNTPARKAGISSGDIIYTINGYSVNSKTDIETILLSDPRYVEIQFIAGKNNHWKRVSFSLQRLEQLGIIPVPEGNETVYTEFKNQSLLRRAVSKLGNMLKGYRKY